MTTNQKLIPVLCLIVGLAGGLFVGFILEKSSADTALTKYQASLKARFASLNIPSPQMTEVKRVSGSIKAISGETVTVALQSPRELFGDPALDERTVTVGNNTKISILVQKDMAVFQKEMDTFQSVLKNQKPGVPLDPSKMPTPPQMFDKKESTLSSLKVGQVVNIVTAENVKTMKSFIAASIEVSPAPPTAPSVIR